MWKRYNCRQRVFLKIVQHIDSHSHKQFGITILGKMMENKLTGNVFYLT